MRRSDGNGWGRGRTRRVVGGLVRVGLFTGSVVVGVVVVAPMTGAADVGERSPGELELRTDVGD